MIIIALLSIILGALLAVFTLQNAALATVSIFAWHVSAPMAFLLVAAMGISAAATLIALLPAFLRAEREIVSLKRGKKEAEDELAKYRITIPIAPPAADSGALIMGRPEVREPVRVMR